MTAAVVKGAKAVPPELDAITRRTRFIKDKVAEIEEQKKLLEAEFDELMERKVPTLMEQYGLDSIHIPEVGRLKLGEKIQAYCKVADQPTFFAWLRENKNGAMIKESIHHGTLCSWVKEQMINCEPLPDYLTVAAKTCGVFRRINAPSNK